VPDPILRKARRPRLTLFLAVVWTLIPVFPDGVRPLYGETLKPFTILSRMLIADGFEAKTVQALYADAKVKEDLDMVRIFFRHREAKLDYGQFTTPWAIRKARAYLRKHEENLDAVEKRYGVDKTVIAAILLVETRLGTSVGKRSVLNTLSTLAALSDTAVQETFYQDISKTVTVERDAFRSWAEKKSGWAYTELKAFLKYTLREKLDPVAIPGSYAGALGIAQFMPTSILAYANDGNRDGRIDLFDHADAAASIAGYLKHFGWHPGIDREKAFQVVFRYNRSRYYVDTVLKISTLLKG